MSDSAPGIDPTSSVPKHLQLKDLLARMLADGMQPGTPIPSERDLAEQYGLSRMTVRQAINALVADGRLERRLGRGTFVAQPKMDVQIRLVGFTEDMRRRGMTASSRTLSFERIHASSALAAHLEVESGEPVVRLVRLRYADGIPMAVERTHLPERIVPGLVEAGAPESLYGYLAQEYGIVLTWGEQSIEAATTTAEDSPLLGIRPDGVVLVMTRRSFAEDVQVEYATSAYRADRYQLWVPLAQAARPIVRNP
ncbi:MAG: GntR family transcriptional regulator [Catenulisporales bacterium]|nr:GntR family transcriptional regulator [Catenulisporales bacterium]